MLSGDLSLTSWLSVVWAGRDDSTIAVVGLITATTYGTLQIID